MRMWLAGLPLLCGCLVAPALAADPPSTGSMSNMSAAAGMPKPGAETMALGRIFTGTATWKGDVPAGALGPDSKAMTSSGKAVMKNTLDGWWYDCDIEDVLGTGKDAMTWRGKMMLGWDPGSKSYRGYSVDNMGTSSTWTGTMNGDTFTLQTDQPQSMMGQSFLDRLTWTLQSDGNTALYKDEHQMVGSTDWVAFESATMHRTGGMKMAAQTGKKQ